MRLRLVVDGEGHDVDVEPSSGEFVVEVDGAVYRLRVDGGPEEFLVRRGPRGHHVMFRGRIIVVDGQAHDLLVASYEDVARPAAGSAPGRVATIEVRPPMPGRVVRVTVEEGTAVRRGQALAVLEAMKMQNEIPAPADGVVRRVGVREGESIGSDRVIAVLEATRGVAGAGGASSAASS